MAASTPGRHSSHVNYIKEEYVPEHYNFPETTFSQRNTFSEQMDHADSECREFIQAECGTILELDELTDIVHSWETLRRIDPERVQASIERVKAKNAARGYYVEGEVLVNSGCGADCSCEKGPGPLKTAINFLSLASETLSQRGQTYDTEGGERSMGKAVAAFNAITGQAMTEAEGWLLLQMVKDARQWSTPDYHEDSAVDGVGYSALKAEALARGE